MCGTACKWHLFPHPQPPVGKIPCFLQTRKAAIYSYWHLHASEDAAHFKMWEIAISLWLCFHKGAGTFFLCFLQVQQPI